MIQLDFFEPHNELDLVRSDIKSIKESSNKVRKSMFARHNELAKLLIDINERLEILERNICQNKI